LASSARASLVDENKDALMARAKEVMTEGRDFGGHSDNQGCVNEGVARYKKERECVGNLSKRLHAQLFWTRAARRRAFCDNVPRATEFMKSAQWRMDNVDALIFPAIAMPTIVPAGAAVL